MSPGLCLKPLRIRQRKHLCQGLLRNLLCIPRSNVGNIHRCRQSHPLLLAVVTSIGAVHGIIAHHCRRSHLIFQCADTFLIVPIGDGQLRHRIVLKHQGYDDVVHARSRVKRVCMHEALLAMTDTDKRHLIGHQSFQPEVLSDGIQDHVEITQREYFQILLVSLFVRGAYPMHVTLPFLGWPLDVPIVPILELMEVMRGTITNIYIEGIVSRQTTHRLRDSE
mmetsp:Transcript_10217/g.18435  ORF Transcript_10217/g.18435 Transcript_10217/m.18435 type:complete len:222 (+) Transcript_10217:1642-2307(+)